MTRVVRARVGNHLAAEDLVQEVLARVLASLDRIEEGGLEAYAVTTARNVIATMRRDDARFKKYQPKLVATEARAAPDEGILAAEDHEAVRRALTLLSEQERGLVIAHEVDGVSLAELATRDGVTTGAMGAQLHRIRVRMRVEYLVAASRTDPPTDRCRPVLAALAGRDRRRQQEAGVAEHLLECSFCRRVGQPLVERADAEGRRVVVDVARDHDIVEARQSVRRMAAELGFEGVDLTLIATAVSEMARNIVKFAQQGWIVAEPVDAPPGVRIIVHDCGPGTPDVERAMTDGYMTYGGLGLGLPGTRRIMDEFEIESVPGRGTTITMTKFRKDRS